MEEDTLPEDKIFLEKQQSHPCVPSNADYDSLVDKLAEYLPPEEIHKLWFRVESLLQKSIQLNTNYYGPLEVRFCVHCMTIFCRRQETSIEVQVRKIISLDEDLAEIIINVTKAWLEAEGLGEGSVN